MADDNTMRSYRSNDAYRRREQASDAQDQNLGGSDPLAELARLIGQNDPYTDDEHREPPRTAARSQSRHGDPSDWRRHIERPNYTAPEEPPFDADARYAAADPRANYADHDNDPYHMPSVQPDQYADPQQSHSQAGHPQASYPQASYPHRAHAQPAQAHPADARVAHARADYRRDRDYEAPGDYADEPMYAAAPEHDDYAGSERPHAEEDYDDPPRRHRGSSLVTAVVLIGCAMLGTAGAYGYRTYASSSTGTKQAPVIIADSSPSKVVPSADPKSSRSQERVGEQGSDERLVSREEQPVPLPGTSSVPRVVFPSPVQRTPTTTGSTTPSAASNEAPKRVKTIQIRPEGGDTSGQPNGSEAPARGASPPARTATNQGPPPRTASREQPLSLDPNAPAQAEPVRPPPQQRAVTPPAPRETAAPAPTTRVASAPSGGTGGYLVQVSSQRSESDAQSSYRALQVKYSQLKSRQPLIRRADLGSKGVYYRAMVGPFESGEEAVSFCNDLKQAGGQCIIHRN